MGRLPDTFAGQPIKFRIPYNIPGKLLIDLPANPAAFSNIISTQFPEATFLHNVDKPFEIHRMIPRLTALAVNQAANTANQVLVPEQAVLGLEKAVELRIRDVGKNEIMTKAGVSIEDMIDAQTRTWDLEAPYTLVRAEGFEIQVDVLPFEPFLTFADGDITMSKLRVDINWQGYLLVIAAPSETR